MRPAIQWIAVPAFVLGSVCSVEAVSYLTLDQAQQAIFPGAKVSPTSLRLTDAQRKAVEKASGVKVRTPGLKLWRVEGGGWFFIDDVVGKHEFITYALGLAADGTVKQIEVMDYRENYGDAVRRTDWRAQFTGKKHGAKLKLDDDIRSVSGATLSCRALTDGVKRLLAIHDLVLKPQYAH